jgi:two-component system, NtrC family, response regulator HydG
MKKLLIIEDDITYSLILKSWLIKMGFDVVTVSNIARAKKFLEEDTVDLILSDMRLPDADGTVLLEWMKHSHLSMPLIIMTSYADIQSAVQSMKLGAKDYVAKPVNPDVLLSKINESINSTIQEPIRKKEEQADQKAYMMGESDAAHQLNNYINLVSPTNMSVLIIGSSGTGKEHIAHEVHLKSKRADSPFIAIDCGAIPKELAASEFFGHIKGSFTGALTDKIGAFQDANGGTLFLDEIGNLSYEVQVQLLRALQERRIKQIGSTKEYDVDIRLIAATNENLEEAITKGTFREDLYHRINEFTLKVPDLKERDGDILLFANFFLDRANEELDKHVIGFTSEALDLMNHYAWPGNLRQMNNVIKRATLLVTSQFISPLELADELTQENNKPNDLLLYDHDDEKERILKALHQTHQNKSKAAQLLGIDRKTLYNKLNQYEIKY